MLTWSSLFHKIYFNDTVARKLNGDLVKTTFSNTLYKHIAVYNITNISNTP